MGIAAWVKILIALVSLALLINNANKVKEFISPTNSSVNVNVNPNPTVDKAKGVLDGFVDWLSSSTQINQYAIPNWMVLVIVIVVLFALFRR